MRNKSKRNRRWGPLSIAAIVVAMAVFGFSLYRIIVIQMEYKRGNDEYSELENEFITRDGDSQGVSIMDKVDALGVNTDNVVTDPTLNKSGISVDFDALQAENPDIVAWIHFPNIQLSYPVLQGEDNDYYLKYTFKKEKNSNGSIFIDAANSNDFADDNTLIFGHNMKSGAMFGQLKQYKDSDFFAENPYFYILRPGFGADRYQIFSYYQTDSLQSYKMTFADSTEKSNYIESITGRSIQKTDVFADVTDKIVTLVTCPQGPATADTRFIVHARLAGK